jgi:hypothetical protein
MIYLYAATCHVVALSEISVHVSLVSDTDVQVSEVLGIAPHPKPKIVPTAPVAPLPIISIEMTFATVPTDPVPLTPVMAWNDMTSASTVPTEPVDALPVADRLLLLVAVPGESVALFPGKLMAAL